jgi:hypothetical protein
MVIRFAVVWVDNVEVGRTEVALAQGGAAILRRHPAPPSCTD